MTLYRRPETSFWYYEFSLEGKRYRGSTKTADKRLAAAFEVARHLEVTQALKRLRDEITAPVRLRLLWDVAQSWLEWSERTLADHTGNLSRVRKLFGREMRLVGAKWQEVDSGRFGLLKTTTVGEVTPEVLEALRNARRHEGGSPATIEREMALLQSVLSHVGARLPYKPAKRARERVNKVLALPAQPGPPEAPSSGFSASQYEAAASLRGRLERSLQTAVTLRIAVGEPHRMSGADEKAAGTPTSPATS